MEKVNLKDKTVLVCDFGLFIEIARTLAKSFKKVYYHNSSWKSAFPKSNSYYIGYGVEELEVVPNFWDVYDEVDLFVFPDVYSGDLQIHLESMGKRVWGGRNGEEGELDRVLMKEHMKDLGLPVGKYDVVKGLEALRVYLKANKDKWIKVSCLRGDMETFYSPNYKFVEPKLDELEHTLGPIKYITEFVVEENLKDKVEIGYDGWTIDGQYPSECLAGIEIKDLGYIGIAKKYTDLPKEITDFNTKMSATFKEWGYRGFMSTELRVGMDKKAYMVDLCSRSGSPPNELYQNMYTNLAEVMWYGSEGIVVDPIIEGKFGVEALIHSPWADKNWQQIEFPKEFRDNIKIRNLAVINGQYYAVPQTVGLPEIGAVVAHGETLDEAIEKVKEIADQVKGYYLDIKIDSIDKGLEEFKKLEEYGIKLL